MFFKKLSTGFNISASLSVSVDKNVSLFSPIKDCSPSTSLNLFNKISSCTVPVIKEPICLTPPKLEIKPICTIPEVLIPKVECILPPKLDLSLKPICDLATDLLTEATYKVESIKTEIVSTLKPILECDLSAITDLIPTPECILPPDLEIIPECELPELPTIPECELPTPDCSLPTTSTLVEMVTEPVKNVVSLVTDLLPDPTDADNATYNAFETIFDAVGQTLIELPTALTATIPGVSLVGEVVSSAISAVVKDVGIVADHFIMNVGQIADAIDTTVTGTANIINKLAENPLDIDSIIFSDDCSCDGEVDSVVDIASHLYSYAVNNLEGHVAHDLDLLASPVDLVVDILNDIECGTGLEIPGSDLLDTAIDTTVLTLRDDLAGSAFDALRDLGTKIGLDITDVGTMPHKDHVNEGNIRGDGNDHHSSDMSDMTMADTSTDTSSTSIYDNFVTNTNSFFDQLFNSSSAII